jgi:starch-binding outer membrane protein, SusD/RagB family
MRKFAAFAIAAVVLAGCKDNPQVNPVDAPSVTALAGALTRTSLQALATGVLAQNRSAVSDLSFYTLAGIYGRDVYRIDASEPRYVSETLGGQPDPSSFAGGRGWSPYYTSIRAENTVIGAVPGAATNQVSALEKSATLGFIKTMKALDYYDLISLRDTVGVSIQSDDPAVVTDIKCKPAVINYIAALLDSAQSDLNAAGASTALPFKLPSGFTAFGRDYSKVSNILLFNRALKGRIDFYRALNRQAPQPSLYATAITELTTALGGAAPGAVPASQLAFGPYYVFVPGGTEAAPNPISDARVGLNPILTDSLQQGDTRASKIVSRALLTASAPFQSVNTTITYVGAVSSLANQARPIGILRDEELVFLRAQAENEAGLFAAATADLNSVRATYNLPPVAITSVTQGRSLILWDKRYSLLFEGPQRLVDLRAYGYLNASYLRKETTTDPFNSAFPIPSGERDARGGSFVCTA